MNLPLHHLPTRRMAALTAQAKAEQRRAKRKAWIERHIVAPDPYDDGTISDGIGPLSFILIVGISIAVYLAAGWWIFNH